MYSYTTKDLLLSPLTLSLDMSNIQNWVTHRGSESKAMWRALLIAEHRFKDFTPSSEAPFWMLVEVENPLFETKETNLPYFVNMFLDDVRNNTIAPQNRFELQFDQTLIFSPQVLNVGFESWENGSSVWLEVPKYQTLPCAVHV